MNEVNITKELEEEIMKMHRLGIYSTEISRRTGLSLMEIYSVYKRNHKTHPKKCFVTNIRGMREQIILGGLLGHGRIKKNGNGYYYSECHALDEADYCEWKFRMLGDLTEGHRLYAKNANNKYSDAVEFTTTTTMSLEKYKNMTRSEIIDKLNLVGFLIFLLDDGWIRKDTNQFCISGGMLTREELEFFCIRCDYLGLKNVHVIGRKNLDLSIPKDNNFLIVSTVLRVFLRDKDMIRKKFYFMYKDEEDLVDESTEIEGTDNK
jgi:hypothetical protein